MYLAFPSFILFLQLAGLIRPQRAWLRRLPPSPRPRRPVSCPTRASWGNSKTRQCPREGTLPSSARSKILDSIRYYWCSNVRVVEFLVGVPRGIPTIVSGSFPVGNKSEHWLNTVTLWYPCVLVALGSHYEVMLDDQKCIPSTALLCGILDIFLLLNLISTDITKHWSVLVVTRKCSISIIIRRLGACVRIRNRN